MNRRSIMIASALFLAVGASKAFAQDMIPHPQFGILAGVDFAKLRGDDADGLDSKTGFVGGLSATFHFARHLGVEVDGLYSMEGAKLGNDQENGDVKLKLDYIRVPILLKVGIPTHSSVRPFVVVGPSLGFKISCKESDDTDSVDCDSGEGTDVKSFDFAGLVGAGVGFHLGKEEVSLQGRYTYGFSKIIDGSDAKNSNFAILAGFSF